MRNILLIFVNINNININNNIYYYSCHAALSSPTNMWKKLVLEDSYDPVYLGATQMLLEQNWVSVKPLSWGKLSGQLLQVSCVWDHSVSPVWGGAPAPVSPTLSLDLICHWLVCWCCPSVSLHVVSLATLDPFKGDFPRAMACISYWQCDGE